jgi:hypothetical protein
MSRTVVENPTTRKNRTHRPLPKELVMFELKPILRKPSSSVVAEFAEAVKVQLSVNTSQLLLDEIGGKLPHEAPEVIVSEICREDLICENFRQLDDKGITCIREHRIRSCHCFAEAYRFDSMMRY